MKPPPYALRLAVRGIPVFPCNAKKRPCTRHGFKDATVDTAELIALWRERPGPLIGFPTGPASGLDLLDIDPRHGGDVWLAHHLGHLGETLTVRTRSGGTHLFFKHWPGMRNSQVRNRTWRGCAWGRGLRDRLGRLRRLHREESACEALAQLTRPHCPTSTQADGRCDTRCSCHRREHTCAACYAALAR